MVRGEIRKEKDVSREGARTARRQTNVRWDDGADHASVDPVLLVLGRVEKGDGKGEKPDWTGQAAADEISSIQSQTRECNIQGDCYC